MYSCNNPSAQNKAIWDINDIIQLSFFLSRWLTAIVASNGTSHQKGAIFAILTVVEVVLLATERYGTRGSKVTSHK